MKFRGDRCFVTEWAGFEEFKPINIIIGRNNVGKSQLLDLVRSVCLPLRDNKSESWQFLCSGILDEAELRQHFNEHHSSNDLGGNHWDASGSLFVGADVSWVTNSTRQPFEINLLGSREIELTDARRFKLTEILREAETPLQGRQFVHLVADRDIQPEMARQDPLLESNGEGATNLIRRHITSKSAQYPREKVQTELRQALNEIFGPDGNFTELEVQQDEDGDQKWEVYLGEENKGGLIALSASGSGLKTVILVLLNLLLVPNIARKSVGDYVFAFEELENNLHPALLRRLLKYIEKFASENNVLVFLTTHSSVALDLFGSSEQAQIIHVEHDGRTARTTTIQAHFDRLGVISALGAKPSDLLQANGIVWVEGPSDAIYLNNWIELQSNGRLREGRDYICAFYGGSLLARTQFVGPDEAEDELVNLLQLNHNVVVVCDGDRTEEQSHLKPRVRRIQEELQAVPGAVIWITQPKEIEGYLPSSLVTRALGLEDEVRAPGEFEQIFPLASKDGSSYVESVLGRSTIDKIEWAAKSAKEADRAELSTRFDWERRMIEIIEAIERWNK